MTKTKLLAAIAKEDYPQSYFATDYDGGCPCFSGDFEVDGYKAHIWGRCWRVSDNAQDLYLYTDHPDAQEIADAVKKQLDAQEWYNPYTVILHPYAEHEALPSEYRIGVDYGFDAIPTQSKDSEENKQ